MANEESDESEQAEQQVLKHSPFHDQQTALDAVFYDSSGWAGVFWYDESAERASEFDIPEGVGDSPAIGVEHLATRENVGFYDLTLLTPIEIRGPGATQYVQRLFSNDMDIAVDRATYTMMLNEAGNILGDIVVSRLEPDRYLAVTVIGPAGREHAEWMRDHAPDDVAVVNRNSAYAGIGLWGPRARDLIEPLTNHDVSNEGFPYFDTHQFEIAGIPVIGMRLSFVGELGWELWTPTEYGSQLWDTLWEAGQEYGAVGLGDGALVSLSGEKSYRMWGFDMTDDHNPYEAGLGFTVDMDTEFIGKSGLQESQSEGIERKMACITLEDSSVTPDVDAEVVVDGDAVGSAIRTEYGYTVGESIVFAYLPVEHVEPGTGVEVRHDGERYAGTIREEPLFDPDGSRMAQ